MSEKLKPCPFCGGPATDLDEVTTKEDRIEGDPIIACLSPDCPQVTSRLMFWNNRPGEATARREALNEVTKELIDQHQNPGEKIQLLTNWSARSVLKVITKLLEEKP